MAVLVTLLEQDIMDLGGALSDVSQQQLQLAEGMGRSLEALGDLGTRALGLEEGLGRSLAFGEEIRQRQSSLMQGLGQLEELEARRAQDAVSHWKVGGGGKVLL